MQTGKKVIGNKLIKYVSTYVINLVGKYVRKEVIGMQWDICEIGN